MATLLCVHRQCALVHTSGARASRGGEGNFYSKELLEMGHDIPEDQEVNYYCYEIERKQPGYESKTELPLATMPKLCHSRGPNLELDPKARQPPRLPKSLLHFRR